MFPAVLGQLFTAAVLAALGTAAVMDVRTSEVPDRISVAVAAAGLVFWAAVSAWTGSPGPLLRSLLVGTAFAITGWTMYYYARLWGGADAFVLGAVGFAFPQLPPGVTPVFTAPWPFPFSLVMTVLFAGSVFSLGWAVAVAIRHPGFLADFWSRLRAHAADYRRIALAFLVIAGGTGAYATANGLVPAAFVVRQFALSALLLAGLLALIQFLRTVQEDALTRTVEPGELRGFLERGWVLAEPVELDAPAPTVDALPERLSRRISGVLAPLTSLLGGPGRRDAPRIQGLSDAQVAELEEAGDPVTVQTGTRFIPAFPVAVLVLATLGDPVFAAILALV